MIITEIGMHRAHFWKILIMVENKIFSHRSRRDFYLFFQFLEK